MSKIELNLLENAIDSLHEALLKYEDGFKGNLKAFKFSVLHFSHFFELSLKYYVSQSHELLIYKNPFSKNIGQGNTIGIWDALQFLRNEGHEFDNEFIEDLRWFKKVRNDIEHHRFSLDTEQTKEVLGRLMLTFNSFNSLVTNFDLKTHIDPSLLESFESLADSYKSKLRYAVEKADQIGGTENGYYCSDCGHAGTMSFKDGVYKCHYCDVESFQVECSVCSNLLPENEAHIWNDDHPNYTDYVCTDCCLEFESTHT